MQLVRKEIRVAVEYKMVCIAQQQSTKGDNELVDKLASRSGKIAPYASGGGGDPFYG